MLETVTHTTRGRDRKRAARSSWHRQIDRGASRRLDLGQFLKLKLCPARTQPGASGPGLPGPGSRSGGS